MSDSMVCHNRLDVRSCIQNANSARVHLDAFSTPDKHTVKFYLRHLQDCYDCPTLGFLAKRNYYNTGGISMPSNFVRNKGLIEYDDVVIDMKMKIKERLSVLYPRTKYIREYITNKDRISLYNVKPLEKYTFWDKLMIGSRMLFKSLMK